jgi:hypothetical protein
MERFGGPPSGGRFFNSPGEATDCVLSTPTLNALTVQCQDRDGFHSALSLVVPKRSSLT